MVRPSRSTRHDPRRGSVQLSRALLPPPLVNGYAVALVAPINGYFSFDLRQQVTILGTSSLGTDMDVQVEWRTGPASDTTGFGNWVPSPIYVTNLSGIPSGVPYDVEPPADLGYFTWYYRARTGIASSNIWSAWSPQAFFNLSPVLGSVSTYIDLNVGVENVVSRGDYSYVDVNVGVKFTQARSDSKYIDLNVGVPEVLFTPASYADLNVGAQRNLYQPAAYADLNVLVDGTPVPRIWWVRPEQGKEGYLFNIYGHGFGEFQGEHNGKVVLGSLDCAIARWETIPPTLRETTVSVRGTPRSTQSTTTIPTLLINTLDTLALAAGDIIEYDMMWEGSSRIDIFPIFSISTTTTDMGYGVTSLNDTTGDAWISDQPEAYNGAWHHRRFVVPTGHYLIDKTILSFGVGWYEFDALTRVRAGAIRSFVIRSADGTPRLWVTGDDGHTAPEMTYVANGGALVSSSYDREGHTIEHGSGLGGDIITPEHGWIVAIVPPGAVSSMVRVTLGDD